VVVPSGNVVVVVLSTELLLVLPALVSLSSTYQIHYGLLPLPASTGTSPTTPHPPSEGLSFSLSYSQFSLKCSMYVCVETRFGFVYYIAVM
jgi:hypothetical protein